MATRKPQPEEVRREGCEGQRPGFPGSPAPGRSGQIRNNASRLQEEEGSPATLSLLLCMLPVPRAFSLEKILKAAFELNDTHHHLKTVNLANDTLVLPDRVIEDDF